MEKKNIDWENLSFAYMPVDKSYVSNYKDGAWDDGILTTILSLSASAQAFSSTLRLYLKASRLILQKTATSLLSDLTLTRKDFSSQLRDLRSL